MPFQVGHADKLPTVSDLVNRARAVPLNALPAALAPGQLHKSTAPDAPTMSNDIGTSEANKEADGDDEDWGDDDFADLEALISDAMGMSSDQKDENPPPTEVSAPVAQRPVEPIKRRKRKRPKAKPQA